MVLAAGAFARFILPSMLNVFGERIAGTPLHGATLLRLMMRHRRRAAGIGSPPLSCGGPLFGPSPQS